MDRSTVSCLVLSLLVSVGARAEGPQTPVKAVLADVEMLEQIGADVLAVHNETGVGFARLSADQEHRLSELSHSKGRCAGFEALGGSDIQPNGLELSHVFGQLSEQEARNRRFALMTPSFSTMQARGEITAALNEVSEDNLRATVQMMSNFNNRLHNGSSPNASVDALAARIRQQLEGKNINYTLDLISHSSTPQKSIRVRLTGKSRPNEIVVLGGHQDSINHEYFGSRAAPGADDNASGSSNILEALRIMASKGQPERTVEFFWYAGEEGGLLGSAEIARTYKNENKDVVGVLQLDMTLFPGDGEMVIGSMTDFTNAWLRSYFANLNSLYINARIVDDRCGYGCSDHASWHRQGFPAIIPFEATMNRMNDNLHTTRDVVDSQSNFRHSAMFAKVALAFAMDLGNSTMRQP